MAVHFTSVLCPAASSSDEKPDSLLCNTRNAKILQVCCQMTDWRCIAGLFPDGSAFHLAPPSGSLQL